MTAHAAGPRPATSTLSIPCWATLSGLPSPRRAVRPVSLPSCPAPPTPTPPGGGLLTRCGTLGTTSDTPDHDDERRAAMSKRGRKRRSRKGNKANHGKRPNA
ncbi:hypothetical protein GCM10027261_29000 [Geodermatophilus arenarius]